MSNGDIEILKVLDSRRIMDLEELDTLADRYFMSACIGNDKAASIYLKVVERRAKLLGLDTPTKISMEVTTYDASELNRQFELLQRNANGQDETALD
jgi:hypothetical protein